MQLRVLTTLGTLVGLSLIVAGCSQTTASSGVTRLTCTSFPPITWSDKDTPETVRQVKQHNAGWKAVCR